MGTKGSYAVAVGVLVVAFVLIGGWTVMNLDMDDSGGDSRDYNGNWIADSWQGYDSDGSFKRSSEISQQYTLSITGTTENMFYGMFNAEPIVGVVVDYDNYDGLMFQVYFDNGDVTYFRGIIGPDAVNSLQACLLTYYADGTYDVRYAIYLMEGGKAVISEYGTSPTQADVLKEWSQSSPSPMVYEVNGLYEDMHYASFDVGESRSKVFKGTLNVGGPPSENDHMMVGVWMEIETLIHGYAISEYGVLYKVAIVNDVLYFYAEGNHYIDEDVLSILTTSMTDNGGYDRSYDFSGMNGTTWTAITQKFIDAYGAEIIEPKNTMTFSSFEDEVFILQIASTTCIGYVGFQGMYYVMSPSGDSYSIQYLWLDGSQIILRGLYFDANGEPYAASVVLDRVSS